jgi:hypothetical protein
MPHRQRPKRSSDDSQARQKKVSRKVPLVVLFLILGGVSGSLLIVAASAVLCIWLWRSPPDSWWAAKSPDAMWLAPRDRNFALPAFDPPGKEAGDGGGHGPLGQDANAPLQLELPPPPRELEFASPPPKNADPPNAPQGPANPQLPPEVVQKVNRATVYLRVTLPDGRISQGSGFFGVEPNIVLTNAHVVGMLQPESRRPQNIEVVLNSGGADERKLTAALLGVDRNVDLAVLRVTGRDLPPPLPVRSAQNLQLSQLVYVFGFPFGADLGKEITLSPSSVSSLRREHGVLTKVQVNGGMHPGNSGGPVVDAYGNVIGVAVSVLRFTQINFAVPGDQVCAVLYGRVSSLFLGQAYRSETRVKVPVAMHTIDPLGHMRAPALEVWTGNPTPATRPAMTVPPPVQDGDSPHQQFPLEYHDQVARGEILLPPVPPGKVCWLQPSWKDPAGESRWATANVYPLPPPVERKAVPLVLRHQVGSRPLILDSWLDLKWFERRMSGREGAEHTLTASTETRLTETTEAVDAHELASVRLQYDAFNEKLSGDNQDVRHPDIPRARQNIKRLAANLRVDKQGNLVGNEVDWNQIPADLRPVLAQVHEQLEQAMETIAVPLPNRQVSPGESWKAERPVGIRSLGRPGSLHLEMTYTYAGSRRRAGHEEAVLELKGEIRPVNGQPENGTGHANGVASVDLESGQVIQADMVLVFNLEMNSASGKLALQLRREVQAGK